MENTLKNREGNDTALEGSTEQNAEEQLFVAEQSGFGQRVAAPHIKGMDKLGEGQHGKAHGGVAGSVSKKCQRANEHALDNHLEY